MEVNIKEVSMGLYPNTSPIATPAREECDRVSPIMEYLFKTRNVPTAGHNMDMNIPAMIAFCIKLYCNIISLQ